MEKLPASGGPYPAAELPDLLRRATAAFQSGRLVDAEPLFKAVLAVDPANFDALHRLAIVQSMLGRPGEALESFDKAIAVNPARADAHNNRGAALQELQRFDEALASHDAALACKPGFVEAIAARAAALHGLKRLEEALAGYNTALAIRPVNAEALYNRGNTLTELKRYEEALASYDRALAIRPNDPEALNNRGNCLKTLRHLDEALAAYERAVAIKPDFAAAHCNAGSALLELGKFDEAVSRYRRALVLKPDFFDARINLGVALANCGKLDEAAAEAKIVAQYASQPSFSHFSYGVLLARCGMAEEACVQFNLCLAGESDDHFRARLALASLGQEPVPQRAPDAFIVDLYKSQAASWDPGASGNQPYRGAELVARAVERLAGEAGKLDVLDAGCGTGLIGTLIRPRACRLDGIDLSAVMLAKARVKNIYDALVEGDLVTELANRPGSYDLITAAATLIHFGDLQPVLQAAAGALRGGGRFVFTVFPNDDNEDEFAIGSVNGLLQFGCYVHGRAYLARAAAAAGFAVELLDRDIHEYSQGEPRFGLVVGLRKSTDLEEASVASTGLSADG